MSLLGSALPISPWLAIRVFCGPLILGTGPTAQAIYTTRPSGSEDPRIEPAEAVEAKEQRDKGGTAESQVGQQTYAQKPATLEQCTACSSQALPHEVAHGAPVPMTNRERPSASEAGCGGRHQGRLAAEPLLLP